MDRADTEARVDVSVLDGGDRELVRELVWLQQGLGELSAVWACQRRAPVVGCAADDHFGEELFEPGQTDRDPGTRCLVVDEIGPAGGLWKLGHQGAEQDLVASDGLFGKATH